MDLINATSHDFVDISSEEYREYRFAGGGLVRIARPQHLAVSKSGGHRILDADGVSHYIPSGWLQLSWLAKSGHPHFVK